MGHLLKHLFLLAMEIIQGQSYWLDLMQQERSTVLLTLLIFVCS